MGNRKLNKFHAWVIKNRNAPYPVNGGIYLTREDALRRYDEVGNYEDYHIVKVHVVQNSLTKVYPRG